MPSIQDVALTERFEESNLWPWPVRRHARDTYPSHRQTCPYTCRPILSSRDADRATRLEPSTLRKVCPVHKPFVRATI